MSDLISRQKVMWILTNLSYTQCKTQGEADVIETAKTLVITMPSAQPEVAKDTNVLINDCISRQVAIEAQERIMSDHPLDGYEDGRLLINALKALPPAQPEITLESAIDYLHSIGWMQEHDRILSSAQSEIIHCKDCKWGDWYTSADGKRYCYCMETGNGGRTENDYCSYAERRTDEQV